MRFSLLKTLIGGADQAEFARLMLRDRALFARQTVVDNHDHARFGFDGIDRSGVIDADEHSSFQELFREHAGDFLAASRLLRDSESQQLFRRLILYRMLGHVHVAIREGAGWRGEAELYRQAKTYDEGESRLPVDGLFGRIHHHTGVPTPSGAVSLDCWNANVVSTALKRQYFLTRGDIVVEPGAGDIVVDAGACFGDTAVYFAKAVGESGHVHAFDPLPAHTAVIDFNVAQNGLQDRISVVPLAVGDTTTAAAPPVARPPGNLQAQPGFSLRGSASQVPVTSLDDFARERRLARVDFIKMDVEGFELAALKGAERLIERCRPRLAISLYHRPCDLFELPLWIADRFPWYEFSLDHYTIHHEETVLFASPRPE
jgi:FkbM family methyltransferase